MIQDTENIDPEDLLVCHERNGRLFRLEDGRTLSDYAIGAEETLRIVFDYRNRIHLNPAPKICSTKTNWNALSDATIAQFKYHHLPYRLIISWMYRHYVHKHDLYMLPPEITHIILQDLTARYFPKEFRKRIRKEIERIPERTPKGVVIRVHPDNYRHFLIEIEGPKGSPYEGGTFYVEMFLTNEYPMKPPKVLFLTPIIHPHVWNDGRLQMKQLKGKWSPALTIFRLSALIRTLLADVMSIDCKYDDFDLAKEAKAATQKYAIHAVNEKS